MSSLTSRLGLYKPAGPENYNVTTDLNNNLDALDAAVGNQVVTSSTRPASAYSGKAIWESDTGRIQINSNLTASGAPTWRNPVADHLLGAITLGGTITSSGAFNNSLAASATSAFTGKVFGDAQARWAATAGGVLNWSSGASAADTNLYRSIANRLKTDDTFEAVGGFIGGADSSITGNLAVIGTITQGASANPVAFAMASGVVSLTLTAAAGSSASATFPAGRFSVAPNVMVTLNGAAGGNSGSSKLSVRARGVTTSGFTVEGFTGDGTTTTTTINVAWQAVQMLSGAASG